MQSQSARLALGFALVGLLWIYFSDRLVPANVWFQTYKGWGFVLVTSLFLYVRQSQMERAWTKSQEELLASTLALREFAERVDEVIWVHDRDGRLLYASPRFHLLFGEVRLGESPDWRGIDPQERDRVQQFRQAWPDESRELQYRLGDPKEARWVSEKAFPVFGPGGALVRVVRIARDVTLLRQEHERRQRWLEELSAILEHASDGILAVDMAGEVIFRNRAAEEMFGSCPRPWLEVLSRPSEELAHVTLPGKDGEAFPLAIHAQTAQLQGCARTILTCQDLRERVRCESVREKLETDLRQSQKMQAVGQLAGGIAHDFNNLLTIVLGNCDQMNDNHQIQGEDRKSVQEIREAAERASQLTRQLLLFSRRQEPRMALLDLNEVVGELLRMLKRVLGPGLEVLFRPHPELPRILGDRCMLEQVLMNLSINARDAMPEGGTLQISVGTTDEWVEVQVQDTGIGISSDRLTHIFEPFYTTKPVGQGTGLGLATAYGIVLQHKGKIEVESCPGHGTLFRIRLPIEAPPARPLPAAPPVLPGGQGVILVVDDEPGILRLACQVLQRCGYTLLQASSGREALDVWEKEKSRIDVLLTDLTMPDGPDGYELSARLLAERPDLKVVFMSGFSSHRKASSEARAACFLAKPFRASELAGCVHGLVPGNSRVPA